MQNELSNRKIYCIPTINLRAFIKELAVIDSHALYSQVYTTQITSHEAKIGFMNLSIKQILMLQQLSFKHQ